MNRFLVGFTAALVAFSAQAEPMRLTQQGRVLDGAGGPVNGVHDLEIRLVDGGNTVRHVETFGGYTLLDGYFSLDLGGGAVALDSSVFLDHGALELEVVLDGESMTRAPLGGYAYAVARQSLGAREITAQQLVSDVSGVQATATSTQTTVEQLDTDLAALALAVASIASDVSSIESNVVQLPTYSTTCNDWEARNWASEDACLRDGRWHHYASSNGSWDDATRFQAWWDASKVGADTKVRIGYDWYYVTVRHTGDSSGPYMFVQNTGSKHLSFRLTPAGEMTSVHATTGTTNSTWHDHWWDGSGGLGNNHYMTHGYTHRSGGHDIDENRNGGIQIWARY